LDTGAAVQHFVETAVARVFVLVAVADEVQGLEEIRIERANAGRRRRVAGGRPVLDDGAPRRFAHGVQLGEIGLRIETRIFNPRDDERGIGKAGARCVDGRDECRNEVFLHASSRGDAYVALSCT
jgi:hypothetical protein